MNFHGMNGKPSDNVIWSVLLALVLLSAPASSEPNLQLAEAQECTQEPQRLDRLACFDEVFGTPIALAQIERWHGQQPERWRQAYAQEQRRQPGDGPIYRNTGEVSGHLMTLSALGVKPPRPLIAIQCHNNITELSVMMPAEMAEERVTMDFGQGKQLWRVRDEGFVVSGGRGLPAIRTVLNMSGAQSLTVASSSSRLDGLMFDLTDFGDTLKPLREACGW